MARGDALFANCNVDWPDDPRCIQMGVEARWLNHVIWLKSVKEKRETLQKNYNFKYFSRISGISLKKTKKFILEMVDLELLTITDDNLISVVGVRSCHKKLKWREEKKPPHTGPVSEIRGGESERRREGEKESESQACGEDPNFQEDKYSADDVMEICTLATTRYKSTQFSSEIMPQVHNLLAQTSKELIIQAINNVSQMFENSNRPHDKRPGFVKQFNSVSAIKEMAERPVVKAADPDSGDTEKIEFRKMLQELEKKKNQEVREENEKS